MEVRDAVLHATSIGAGPTVLLLHAGGEQREVWRPVMARCADDGMRAVAFDLRGHGESTGRASTLDALAGDVVAMLAAEVPPVTIVGASLGGLAAIAALATPGVATRVAGLVLVDVVPDPDPQRVRSWLDVHGLLARRRGLVENILARGADLLATVAVVDVLVRGGPGSPVSDADVARLLRANPAVSVERIASAGHLVASDAPSELGKLVSNTAGAWAGGALAR